MRAQRFESLDGPESLRAADLPLPESGGQLLIDVVAAGVSFPDVLMSRGLYQMKPPVPFVPGVEVAGTVREAPAGSGFAAGDRVMAVTMLGGFAEVAVAPPGMTCRLPEQFSFEQGAGFILNYHTAHFALSKRAAVEAGEIVVVHGAAGGVGTAAIQVARSLGAEVVAVTSSAEKAEVARRAGATSVVDSGGDWPAELRSLGGGRGADVILDPVGGDRFDESLRCLAPGGKLLVVGFTEGRIPSVAANRLLLRNISVVGVAWGAWLGGDPGLFTATAAALEPMIESGGVAPLIGTSFPLDDAVSALRIIDERRATGKVIITV
ncbi:MAG: NADPH:quinone oxidoreductase family protein [Candidatus Dormibacteraeota bacterium]|uniref:Alcohol dehydrogenase n=1 Tax=Candidatus Aeolococcus gillhamiae TaxID=3127015 RepID=A0A2W6ANI3_9BACT|nr:NADPH:quinone oxidoreductase family protein [Candidatus Dormibacteraeota bacterium]PZR79291.1 MAG: alcohol dehydrogenase [Candidatus Dormibacter sp. RRmetagenome_bin12]